ncbi:MAG: hypothetical protein AAF624_16940 [Bacteroidota bacterium]
MANVSSTKTDRLTQAATHSKTRWGVYAALAVALALSLWIGWSESDLSLTQTEIREGIRSWIRIGIRTALQYAIPAIVLGFFARAFYMWRASRSSSDD